jgi:hypothetical protein
MIWVNCSASGGAKGSASGTVASTDRKSSIDVPSAAGKCEENIRDGAIWRTRSRTSSNFAWSRMCAHGESDVAQPTMPPASASGGTSATFCVASGRIAPKASTVNSAPVERSRSPSEVGLSKSGGATAVSALSRRESGTGVANLNLVARCTPGF